MRLGAKTRERLCTCIRILREAAADLPVPSEKVESQYKAESGPTDVSQQREHRVDAINTAGVARRRIVIAIAARHTGVSELGLQRQQRSDTVHEVRQTVRRGRSGSGVAPLTRSLERRQTCGFDACAESTQGLDDDSDVTRVPFGIRGIGIAVPAPPRR
jgi:hypothetical protein